MLSMLVHRYILDHDPLDGGWMILPGGGHYDPQISKISWPFRQFWTQYIFHILGAPQYIFIFLINEMK